MHREIMEAKRGIIVDHINRNGLDNRKENLRFVSRSQNAMNSEREGYPYTSKYRGVCLGKRRKKWRAYICVGLKQKYLGYFYSEEEAAKAYDAAAKKYRGEYAFLNFK